MITYLFFNSKFKSWRCATQHAIFPSAYLAGMPSINHFPIPRASELGATAAASTLVEAGADGRAHPVTRYGPLYIACYHGHMDIAQLLLKHFPEAVQV